MEEKDFLYEEHPHNATGRLGHFCLGTGIGRLLCCSELWLLRNLDSVVVVLIIML
jgi:hypothetical protein